MISKHFVPLKCLSSVARVKHDGFIPVWNLPMYKLNIYQNMILCAFCSKSFNSNNIYIFFRVKMKEVESNKITRSQVLFSINYRQNTSISRLLNRADVTTNTPSSKQKHRPLYQYILTPVTQPNSPRNPRAFRTGGLTESASKKSHWLWRVAVIYLSKYKRHPLVQLCFSLYLSLSATSRNLSLTLATFLTFSYQCYVLDQLFLTWPQLRPTDQLAIGISLS